MIVSIGNFYLLIACLFHVASASHFSCYSANDTINYFFVAKYLGRELCYTVDAIGLLTGISFDAYFYNNYGTEQPADNLFQVKINGGMWQHQISYGDWPQSWRGNVVGSYNASFDFQNFGIPKLYDYAPVEVCWKNDWIGTKYNSIYGSVTLKGLAFPSCPYMEDQNDDPPSSPSYNVSENSLVNTPTCDFNSAAGLDAQILSYLVYYGYIGKLNNKYVECDQDCNPFLEWSAAKSLNKLTKKYRQKIAINNGYRSPVMDHLYQTWASYGECGLKENVGYFESGKGFTLRDNMLKKWFNALVSNGWAFSNPKGARNYLFYPDASNVTAAGIGAFQQLWNLNYPNDALDVNFYLDTQTYLRLQAAPREGFPVYWSFV